MPYIIVLEGLDGSFKSTNINLMKEYLEDKGYKVNTFHFPTKTTKASVEIHKFLNKGKFGKFVNSLELAKMFADDRKEFLESDEGKEFMDCDVVIFDRYVLSSIIYRCAECEINSPYYNELKYKIEDLEFKVNKLPRPDITIYLENDVYLSKTILSKRDEPMDIFEENFEYQCKLSNTAKDIINKTKDSHNIHTVKIYDNNTILPKDVIFNKIKKVLDDNIKVNLDIN